MADFYTNVPETTADWTNTSKGYKADSGAADAIKGLGDTLSMGVATADNYYQGTIKEQAKTATEELFNASGNAGAVATEGGIKGKQTPQEVQQGYDQLSLLKQAAKNGTLKDSSFWAQAELISRQLKTRYPGYWEQIDGDMSQLLGRKPAIALHAELEQERKDKSSNADKERTNAMHAARTVGLSEVFVAENQGKPIPTNEINRLVAEREGLKWTQESASRAYTAKKQANEATQDDALLAQRNSAQAEVAVLLSDSMSPLGRNVAEYREYAQRLDAIKKSGQPIPAEMQAAATALAGQINQSVADIQNKYTLQYGDVVPANKAKENIGYLKDFASNLTANVQQADMNYTESNVALLKSLTTGDNFQFLTSNDALRMSASITAMLGPQAQISFETRNADKPIIKERDIAIQRTMENHQLLHGKSMTESINAMMSQGVTDPKAYAAHVGRALDAAVAQEMPPQVKSNALESLYGQKNMDFLNTSVPEAERLPMFMKMSAPAMIKQLSDLHDKGTISNDDFQKHVTWVSNNAVQLIRDRAADVNAIATDRKSISVKYNETNQLLDTSKVNYTPEAMSLVGRKVNEASENFLAGDQRRAVGDVNNILRIMKTLTETTGGDPKLLIPELLEKSGIDVNPVPEKGKSGAEPVVSAVEKHVATSQDMTEQVAKYLNENLGAAFEKALSNLMKSDSGTVPGKK